ncbi:unnamed protein product [Symbiodinium sp. KB8]|nr:unnamed protein product [Symbiodinium sp. KB8]
MSSVSRRDAVLTAQAPPPGNSRSPSAAVCRDPHGPLHPPHAQPVAARRAAQSGAQLDERADSAAIKAARVSGISGLPNSRAHPGADWPGDAMRAPGPGPARSTAGQAGPPSAVRPSAAEAEGGFSTLRRPETGSDSATAASAENARSGAPAAEKACGGGTRTAGGDFARGPMSQPCAPDVAAASPGDSASDTRGSVPSESAAPHDHQGEAARGPPALATSPHRGLISKAGESNSAAQVAGAGPVAANARRGRSPALQVSVSPAGQGGIEAAAVSRAAASSGPEHKPQAAPGKDPRAGGSARATAQRSSGLQTDPAREHLKQETAVTSALGVAPGAPWGAALAVPAPPTVDPRQHPDPQATLVARGDPRRLQPAGRSSLLHGLAVAASAAGASPAFLAGRGQDDAETPATVQRAGTAPTPAAQAATAGSLTAHPDLAPTSRLDHPGRSFVLGGSWPHTAEAPGPDFALGGSYHPAAAVRAAEAAQPWATAARSGGEAGGHLAPKAHHSAHADDAEARHGGPGAASRSVPAATPAASGKPASDARAESHGATPGSGRHSVSDEDRGAPVDPDALNGTPQTPSELLTQAREAARMRLLHAGFDATTCERIRHHCTREGGFTDPTAFRGSTDAKKRAARSRFRGVFPDGNGRAGFRVHLRLPRALASAARSPQYCFLGRFNTEVEAALVYNAAVRLSGALFKRLNVVPDEDIDALLATGRASCVPATRGRFPSSPPMRYVAPSEAAAQAARPGFAAGGWEAGPGVSARAAAAVPARRRQRKRSRDSSETSSDASADGRHDSGRHSSDEEWTSGGRQAKSARGAAQQAAPGAARAQQRASAPRSARGRGGLEVVTDASSLLPMVPAASTPFGHLAFQPGMLPSPAVQVPSLPVSAAGAFAGQFHAHASANFLPPFSHELAPASGPPAAHTWATAASSGAPATSSSASAAEGGPASSPGTGLGAAASGARGRDAAGDAPWQVPSSTSA